MEILNVTQNTSTRMRMKYYLYQVAEAEWMDAEERKTWHIGQGHGQRLVRNSK